MFLQESISPEADLLLRALVDSLPQEVAVVDRRGVITATNARWARSAAPLCADAASLGLDDNLLDALHARASCGDADARRLVAGLEAVLAGERESFQLDYAPGAARQGPWFTLEARLIPTAPPALLLCRSDITAQRERFEAALRESEQRERLRAAELQAILDTAPIGLSIALGPKGDRIRGNPALERMFGIPRGGELSRTAREPARFRVFQAGHELSAADLPMQRAVRGEAVGGEILDIAAPDGREITAFATAMPLYDELGNPRGAVGAFLDITRIKRTKEALRESEQRFRCLVESYAQAVWETDAGGMVVKDIPSWRACTGQTVEEAMGVGWLDALHPEDRADAQRRWREAIATRVNYDVEYRVRDRAGGWRWTNLRATPIRGADGTIHKWTGMNIDIDARKDAEAALRESELRLQLALESGSFGIYEWRLDTGRMIWDDRLRALWGLRPGAAASFDVFMQGLHPDDRARAQAEIGLALDGKNGGGYHAEYRLVPEPEAAERWIAVTGTTFLENGRPVRMVGTAQDITHRKRAEIERQNFVSLAEQSVEFIGICDMSFRPLYINPAGMRLVGLKSIEDAMRVEVADFFFPEDQDFILKEFFPKVLREGHANVEIRFRRFDTGEALWMLYNVFFLRDPGGAPIGLATVSRDITERKRVEDALKAADRRKDEFLATLAHELRNPLAPIRNAVHVLLHDAKFRRSPARELTLLSMIDRQAEHLVRLVDDLLEVSRITRGKIELKRQRVDLADVLKHAIETTQPLIDRGRHDLRVDLPAAPLPLDADPVRLAQVFTNLLQNAAKYTEQGGVISLVARQADGEAIVTVRDSGVGIPVEMLPRVFDLFTQVDRSLGRAQGGLGIGLALVKSLLDLHGGTVQAHSDGLGRGSVFEVRLPMASKDGVHEPMPTTPQPAARAAHRILVIDDDHDVADSLVMFLETFGANVRVAYSGEEGLAAVRDFRPKMVFLDIGMPKMDGYETARRLRALQEGRDVKLVALTGWGQDQISDRAQDAGFDCQLTKPAGLDELQALLDSL